jgi:hypothetical protein
VVWLEPREFVEPTLLSESEAVSRDRGLENKRNSWIMLCPPGTLVMDPVKEVVTLLRIRMCRRSSMLNAVHNQRTVVNIAVISTSRDGLEHKKEMIQQV